MKADEAVSNQIVYLTYVLSDQPADVDSALFTPVQETLRRLVQDAGLDLQSQHLAESLRIRLDRWTQLGLVISRESAQRVLSQMRVLALRLQGHAGPADDQSSPVVRPVLDPLRS